MANLWFWDVLRLCIMYCKQIEVNDDFEEFRRFSIIKKRSCSLLFDGQYGDSASLTTIGTMAIFGFKINEKPPKSHWFRSIFIAAVDRLPASHATDSAEFSTCFSAPDTRRVGLIGTRKSHGVLEYLASKYVQRLCVVYWTAKMIIHGWFAGQCGWICRSWKICRAESFGFGPRVIHIPIASSVGQSPFFSQVVFSTFLQRLGCGVGLEPQLQGLRPRVKRIRIRWEGPKDKHRDF